MNPTAQSPVLEAREITKSFSGLKANDGVSIAFRPGKVHAVLGENGAGKTTLLRILYGMLSPDTGDIFSHSQKVAITYPRVARRLGIGMIPQRLLIVPALSVMENLYLGHDGFRDLRPVKWDRARERVQSLMTSYGLDVPLDGRGKDLSVGQAQRLQILKALLQGASILLCDEPTAVLAPSEVEGLFSTIRRLKENRSAIVFITHKLAEAIEIADDVTILRGGKVVGGGPVEQFDRQRLAELIVGHRPIDTGRRESRAQGPVVLSVDGISSEGPGGLDDVSFDLCGGRIVGIAGVEGNGQRDLLEILGGIRKWSRGRIRFLEREWKAPGPMPPRAVDAIPDERIGLGLIASLPIRENVLLGHLDRRTLAGSIRLHRRAIDESTQQVMEAFNVQPPQADLPVEALSGGNQQRLLLGREILRNGPLLIAAQPTQGVDVGSRAALHARLLEERRDGRGILLISSDLEEILDLSDEIMVLYRGKILYKTVAEAVDQNKLAGSMVGWGA
ncbi:MAG: ATP-binding cassette domain-containing protein [Candidatus Eisenbacteria bacterium]|nr:ATP-binding cassette domain-containing protein [Candidatus Eisenbacteria bacterium]